MSEASSWPHNPFLGPSPDDPTAPHLLTAEEWVATDRAPRAPTHAGPPVWVTHPDPITYDLRQTVPEARIKLDGYRSGDVLRTPGADIRIGWNGQPRTSLESGFENGRSAGAVGPVLIPPAPADVSVDDNMEIAAGHAPFWLRETVPNRGPWDYKQRGHKFEAFGNFNYGAAGRAEHLPDWLLLREAGHAQFRDGTTDRSFGKPGLRFTPVGGTKSFGDDPVDQFWIEHGARYYDRSRQP